MKKLKEALFSEDGMRIVNGLFILSLVFARSGLIFIAHLIWIIYLVFCMKNSDSKASRIIYGALIGFASVLIAVNLYFLIKG